MNKKLLFSILLGAVLILPSMAYAADDFCKILDNVRILSMQVGGSIVAIGWVVTGILYLTAGGGERLSIAKKALIACVIGTILIILAGTATGIIKTALKVTNATFNCGSATPTP